MYTYGILFWVPINILYFSVILIEGIVKKRRKEHYFFAGIFCVYMNLLIEKAFFPIFTEGAQFYTALTQYINLDITLLFTYTPYQIIGNFLLMFPMGILLIFIKNGKILFHIISSVLISISIEVIQLLMIVSLHLIDVTFDINDLVLNVAGCLCGHLVFHLFCKVYARTPKKTNRIKLTEYFNQVCDNYIHHRNSLDGLSQN